MRHEVVFDSVGSADIDQSQQQLQIVKDGGLCGLRVAVIGGGWYGCYIALRLAKQGSKVILFEAKSDLFRGCSGTYGIRLHAGPHYPRSLVTRQESQSAMQSFEKELPDLLLSGADRAPATYALGIKDVDGLPPRCSPEDFAQVCRECRDVKELDPEESGYSNIHNAFQVHEPSAYLDKPRDYFARELASAGVKVVFNHRVQEVESYASGIKVDGSHYDWAVNCTYYQSFANGHRPFEAKVVYQPTVTLKYADRWGIEDSPRMSFTVMDGWFPCLMPMLHDAENSGGEKRPIYLLYHAKYTVLGSFATVEEAQEILDDVSGTWVAENVRPRMENDMLRFIPRFSGRYEYIGFDKGMGTKVSTNHEFRAALVWADKRAIHVFSGKINNIVQAAEDTVMLIRVELETSEAQRPDRSTADPATSQVPANLVAGRTVTRAAPELALRPADASVVCTTHLQTRLELNFPVAQKGLIIDANIPENAYPVFDHPTDRIFAQ